MAEDYLWHEKKIGIINIFNEFCSFDKDIFRMWMSVGFETEILEDLKKKGITTIKLQIIHESGLEEWLKAPVDEFLESPKRRVYKGQEQRHLSLPYLRAKYK